MAYYLTYFFRYAFLRNAKGRLAAENEIGLCVLLAVVISSFSVFEPNYNLISAGGLIDRIGQLTSVLTGFFVAALVAISAFTLDNSALDEEIKVGKVYNGNPQDFETGLTRREYVCFMFGYLVGVSFILSSIAIIMVSMSKQIKEAFILISHILSFEWGFVVFETAYLLWKVLISSLFLSFFIHVILVSLRGIFYLMDKMYDKNPRLVKKRKRPPIDPPDQET